jgi:hypothetical protein
VIGWQRRVAALLLCSVTIIRVGNGLVAGGVSDITVMQIGRRGIMKHRHGLVVVEEGKRRRRRRQRGFESKWVIECRGLKLKGEHAERAV